MRQKNNRTCLCCSKTYTFCLHCSDYDHLPRWMNIFHDENCKNLFDITNEYMAGKITAEEAKERYSKCDLSYKNKLKTSIVNAINTVNRAARKKVVKTKVVEENFEKEISEEIVESSKEQIEILD